MSLKHIMHVDWTDERWLKMCGRKVRFQSMTKAKRRAKRNKLRAYPCPFCGGAHLTSQAVDDA